LRHENRAAPVEGWDFIWRQAMKIILAALLFAASALAQEPSSSPTAACGSGNVSYKVKLDDTAHDLLQPEPGKARIYFIHQSGGGPSIAYPTTKIGVDGTWVGANHGDSYFSISVEPGEHHVCATLQSSFYGGALELAHVNAEAGKAYFYRTRLILSRSVELLELEPIDSDQGKYLVESLPLSDSKPKK
jgi:hypothetical protein